MQVISFTSTAGMGLYFLGKPYKDQWWDHCGDFYVTFLPRPNFFNSLFDCINVILMRNDSRKCELGS